MTPSSLPWFEASPLMGIGFAFALILINAFFVAAEFALVRVRPTQLEKAAEEGQRAAVLAHRMTQEIGSLLSATQLGVTLCSLALGWIGEPAFTYLIEPVIRPIIGKNAPLAHTVGLVVSFVIITVFQVAIGELAPKWLAIRDAEKLALRLVFPLFAFYKLTYPANWVLNRGTAAVMKLFGVPPVEEAVAAHDEEELRRLLSSTEEAHVSSNKRELLDNVFELSHRVARQIMLPRQDVIYLSTERSVEENLEIARRSGHTRLPLCREDLDHVIGVVHIKDLFRRERPPRSLEEVVREIAFVPETLELDRLLVRMLAERFHLGAVIDEYGGVSGVVTLEDVIEELVGQIHDEFDTEAREDLVSSSDGSYSVSGGMLVEDLEDALDLEVSDRDEDTIGGVVMSELGRNPAVGDTAHLGPLLLEVQEVQGNRITTLRATIDQPVAEQAAEEATTTAKGT
jgi:CBS domain containing-hemolysin-like protein